MQRIILITFLSTLMTSSVLAQRSAFQFGDDPFTAEGDRTQATSPKPTDESASSATSPYGSYQQAMDTKSQVQRNATIRADQRRRRLAARRWFGYSNSRPIAAAVPFMTHYSPMWASNPWAPHPWYGMVWP